MEIILGIVYLVIAAAAYGCGTYIAICDYNGNGITPKRQISGFAFLEFAAAAFSAAIGIALLAS